MRQQAARIPGLRERLGCARADCDRDALDFSNFCELHRPELQIDQTRGPMPLRWQMALAAGCTALFVWFLPWLTRAIEASRSRAQAVQTFGIYVSCRRPEPGEQIVVLVDAGGAGHECVYVRGRGAYGMKK
jgi:hypothetical protein